MSQATPRPCKCGGEARLKPYFGWVVMCRMCGRCTRRFSAQDGGTAEAKRQAIAAWNERGEA